MAYLFTVVSVDHSHHILNLAVHFTLSLFTNQSQESHVGSDSLMLNFILLQLPVIVTTQFGQTDEEVA